MNCGRGGWELGRESTGYEQQKGTAEQHLNGITVAQGRSQDFFTGTRSVPSSSVGELRGSGAEPLAGARGREPLENF